MSLRVVLKIIVTLVFGLMLEANARADDIAYSYTGAESPHASDTIASPIWSLESLAGRRSYRNGPNCFNAVLAAKGMVSHLRYSDGSELRFYLQQFCRPVTKGGPTDILTVERKGLLEHAAIKLADGQLFEKNSLEGFFNGIATDSTYDIRPENKSRWINGCRSPGCKVKTWQCDLPDKIAKDMRRCEERARTLGFTALAGELEAFVINSSSRAELSPEAESIFKKVVMNLDSISGHEECAPWLAARGLSLVRGYLFIRPTNDLAMNKIFARLRDRILQQDSGATSMRVMAESDWLPVWRPPTK